MTNRTIDNRQDILDSREIETRIDELESSLSAAYEAEHGEDDDTEAEPTPARPSLEQWIATVAGDDDHAEQDEATEYRALVAFREEASTDEWRHGETLIRDSYFEQYAREFADDIGATSDKITWPHSCIDWERAAEELQQDYSSAEFDGVTYWFRS